MKTTIRFLATLFLITIIAQCTSAQNVKPVVQFFFPTDPANCSATDIAFYNRQIDSVKVLVKAGKAILLNQTWDVRFKTSNLTTEFKQFNITLSPSVKCNGLGDASIHNNHIKTLSRPDTSWHCNNTYTVKNDSDFVSFNYWNSKGITKGFIPMVALIDTSGKTIAYLFFTKRVIVGVNGYDVPVTIPKRLPMQHYRQTIGFPQPNVPYKVIAIARDERCIENDGEPNKPETQTHCYERLTIASLAKKK